MRARDEDKLVNNLLMSITDIPITILNISKQHTYTIINKTYIYLIYINLFKTNLVISINHYSVIIILLDPPLLVRKRTFSFRFGLAAPCLQNNNIKSSRIFHSLESKNDNTISIHFINLYLN